MAKHTTKEKLLEAAQTLMLSKGYPATTVDEVCDLASVSKGSFYHLFNSKEELGLAVLEAFQARSERLINEGPQAHVADPVDRALQLLEHLTAVASEAWGDGCLLGSFALDLADTHAVIREAVSEKFRQIAEALAEGMAPLGREGGHPDAPSGAELAEQFIVVVEGALILAKAHKDWSYVTRALERFQKDVHAGAAAGV
jgi:TetR/AcrR family transcriptional repressor of nem operon